MPPTTSAAQAVISKLPRKVQDGIDQLAGMTQRFDGWVNLLTGFGTASDKTAQGFHIPDQILTDWELTSLFNHDDIAARGVDVYPREALRKGFKIKFTEDEKGTVAEAAKEYLKKFGDIPELVLQNRIWSRLYGGSVLWPLVNDGSTYSAQPLGNVQSVFAVRYIDKRFLWPLQWYEDGPKVGLPKTYNVSAIAGQTVFVGEVHESRLIRMGGALTDTQTKRERQSWDLSVLQRPYNALRSAGNVWKGVETLVVDGNQSVFSIKNLMSMIAGNQGARVLERLKIMDMARSISKAIVLDADGEKFERSTVTFAGLADLSKESKDRICLAFEMPYTVLVGASPGGLNATGESDLRLFWGRVGTEQKHGIEPGLVELLNVLFSASDCPVKGKPFEIDWKHPWEATAKEEAEVYKLETDANVALIDREVVRPEEVALSMFPENNHHVQINRKIRETVLKTEEKNAGLDNEAPSLQLTPSDIAKVTKVNEARASQGLSPIEGPDGELTIVEFEAKRAAAADVTGTNEGNVETGQPTAAEQAAAQAEQAAKAQPAPGTPGAKPAPGTPGAKPAPGTPGAQPAPGTPGAKPAAPGAPPADKKPPGNV